MNRQKSEQARTLQDKQLRILKEIDRVCRENGITYWLAFGTAIGAVRHKGFIPWDDDIDLFMSVKDTEKLETLQDSFAPGFFVQSRRTDPEYGLMITRVRDSNTTLIENEEADRDINHGVFVDIYPLYNAPRDSRKWSSLYKKALLARLLQYGKVPRTHGTLMKVGSGVILFLTTKRFRKKIVDRIYRELAGQPESGSLTYAYGNTGRNVYPKDYFYPVKWVEFEHVLAPVPENNDRLLTEIYGNYMELPPVEKQVIHHGFRVVDCETPYLQFKGKEYCVKGKD